MDKARAQYLRTIEQSFVALRGQGFMLSAKDVALTDLWHERGIPLRVVLNGISQGVERFRKTHPPEEKLPSSLAYFKGPVQQAVHLWRERSLGWSAERSSPAPRTPSVGMDPGLSSVREALTAALDGQTDERAMTVLREAMAIVDEAVHVDAWTLAAQVEEIVVDGLHSILSRDEQDELAVEVARQMVREGASSMGPQARLDRERVALEVQIRLRFGVPDFLAVLP